MKGVVVRQNDALGVILKPPAKQALASRRCARATWTGS
jgi:hypothetical protein